MAIASLFLSGAGLLLYASQVPVIVVQPVSQVTQEGSSVVLSVQSSSSSPLSYQWFKNGGTIPNATSTTLTFSNVQASDVGNYHVVVSNSDGSVTSSVASIALTFQAKLIKSSPRSQTVTLGSSVTFTVGVSSALPVTYQWFKDGASIPDASDDTLTISLVRLRDAGVYKVLGLTSEFTEFSQPATLTINEAIPPKIIVQPVSQTNLFGETATFFVEAIGQSSLSYQWLKNGRVVDGASETNLTVGPLGAGDVGSYSVRVTNSLGRASSTTARLTVLLPPSILTHPVNRSVLAGGLATFSSTASGTAPLRFQWLKDGEAIANATNSTLTLRGIKGTQAGNYAVRVTNPYGTSVSSNAVLAVNFSPSILAQPVGQSVVEHSTAALTVDASGSAPLKFQWFRNGARVLNATNAVLTLENVSTNDAGVYRVLVSNAFGSVTGSDATLTVEPGLRITKQPQSATAFEGADFSLSVEVSGVEPISFQWLRSDSVVPGATNDNLRFNPLQVSDAGVYSVFLSNSVWSAFSSNATLTVRVPPTIIDQPASQTVFAGEHVTFSVNAKGDPPLSYQWLRMGTNLPTATNAFIELSDIRYGDSAVFKVVVTNRISSVTSSNAVLTVDPKPVILTQPASVMPILGASVAFSVEATGEPPLEYQWFKDGDPVPAATKPVLPIDTVRGEDAGAYKVLVRGPGGSSSSIEAALTIVHLVRITMQPASQTVLEGGSVTLAVEASGISAVRFQWFKNGEILVGETGPDLHLNRVTEHDAGAYSVKVENDRGSLISSTATVRVVFQKVTRGDFDGDSQPDIVFSNRQGFLAGWFMNGTTLRFPGFFMPNNVGDLSWTVVGSGDFDLDGKEDLLFQKNDGELAVWHLDGRNLKSAVRFPRNPVPGGEWAVVAASDFNHDDKADIVLQHENGTLAIWYLDRVALLSGVLLEPTRPDRVDWRVVGAGDIDRDENVDLVFQDEEGNLAVWYLNGRFLKAAALMNPSHPGDSKWRVVSVADRNNDGKPDLLFQHADSRDLGIWLMDRVNLIDARLLNPPHTGEGWEVVAP